MNMETGYELNVPVGDGNKDVKAIISNNEVIWERAIPTPKSGVAPLSFRATRAKPLLDWEITGKTYQAWTPSPEPQVGNNKLDNSKIEKSSTITNFTYTDSSVSFGSMTVGSTINSAEIKSEDTSYAFSFSGDTNKVTFALKCYNSSHTYLGDANKLFDEENRAVMTLLSNTTYIRLVITTTVQGNISLTNLMLNKGNTVMAFEPFKYLPNTGACPVQGVGDKTENLFDKTKVRSGWYSSSTSQIILSTVDGSFVSIKVKPNTTYTFSKKYFNISSERNTVILTSVYPEDERTDYNTILNRSYSTETWSFTTGSDDNYANIMFARSATDEEIEKIVNTIMLNEGSTALPYEPYGYKVPVVSRGKNLFDCYGYSASSIPRPSSDKVLTNSYGTTISSVNNVNKLTVTQTIYDSPSDAVSYKNGFFLIGVYGLKEGQRYILSFDVTPSNFGILTRRVMSAFPNGQGLGNLPTDVTSYLSLNKKSRISLSFTYHDFNERQYIELRISGVSGVYENFQIESIIDPLTPPTPYEPYIEPITTPIYLNSPLMADETLDSTGKREVEWGKYELTGNEVWSRQNISTDDANYARFSATIMLDIISVKGTIDYAYCSNFITVAQNGTSSSTAKNCFELRKSNESAIFLIVTNKTTDNTDFKAWLKSEYDAGHPVTIWYKLAEPTSETVDVPAIPTLKGNNVIDIDTEVQPSNVSITYLSSGFEPQPLKTADGQMLYTNNNQPLSTLE